MKDAHSVRAEIIENDYIYGEGIAYIGTIEADEDETATLKFNIASNASQIIPIKIVIRYLDTTGDHSFIVKVAVPTTTEKASGHYYVSPFVVIGGLILLLTFIAFLCVKVLRHLKKE